MGRGTWTNQAFVNYSTAKGMSVDASTGSITGNYLAQEMFKQRHIAPELDPYNVMRECCDNEEHPNTVPVVICLDTTGSMGYVGVEVAKKLNVIITELYERYMDIEIMVMGIGDLAYDRAPVQISQFESDIRIAEQLDKVFMERGGGGNGYESYSAAWYFGLKHCKLDCWNRGKKGIIITTGDEPLNPYLPARYLNTISGDTNEADVETNALYNAASEKYDIYHIAINDHGTSYSYYESRIKSTFGGLLGERLKVSTLDDLAARIVDCIDDALGGNCSIAVTASNTGEISW